MPEIRLGEHLPNLRADHRPPHPSWLPRQRRGTTAQMIGRYPDYDVMENASSWDRATREVVEARLRPPSRMRFFGPSEEPTMRALCDTLLAQDRDPKVPVSEMVDSDLAEGKEDGFRYADMPPDETTWRLVLAGMDGLARRADWPDFAAASEPLREEVVGRFAAAELAAETLGGLNPERAFLVCMRWVLSAFYSHPWAWNEIGFGGPAYPRGYMRMSGVGLLEPHERPGATSEDPVGLAREWDE